MYFNYVKGYFKNLFKSGDAYRGVNYEIKARDKTLAVIAAGVKFKDYLVEITE
jgi:hypothetical protein